MNLSDLPDARLRKLANAFRNGETEIKSLLISMLTATPQYRTELLYDIQRIVGQLRRNVRAWADHYVTLYYTGSLNPLVALLEKAGVNVPTGVGARGLASLDAVRVGLTSRVDKALLSITTLAARIARSVSPTDFLDPASRATYVRLVNTGTPLEVANAKTLNLFRERVIGFPVEVITNTGKPVHYELAYYAAVVAASAKVVAENLAPMTVGPQVNLDLVRVSNNPSMHGDYCDAYTGRVFSLSGTHPRFPPLADTPNGGPPFHPWCQHGITPILPGEDLTNALVAETSMQSSDAKAVAKAWKSRRP